MSGSSAYGARVREDGTFVLGGILPGHYYLTASTSPNTTNAVEPRLSRIAVRTYYPGVTDKASARVFEIVAGQVLDDLVIRVESERVYRVRTHLDGIEKAQIGVFPQDGTEASGGRRSEAVPGSFEAMLRAGRYIFIGSATRTSPPGGIVSIYQPLNVSGDTDDVVIRASDTNRMVHGTVRDERGAYPDLNGARMGFVLYSMVSIWSNGSYDVNPQGGFSGEYGRIPEDVRAGLCIFQSLSTM